MVQFLWVLSIAHWHRPTSNYYIGWIVPIQDEWHGGNEPWGQWKSPVCPSWQERRGEGAMQGYRGAGVLGALRAQSSFWGLSQQMSLFTHQIKPLPGSKGPFEKATAGYCLKMKYTTSEQQFHLGVRVRAVYFYKGVRRQKFAVNLEESVTAGAVPAAAPWPRTTIPGTQL